MSKKLKALTERVDAIEDILRDFAGRNWVTADVLKGRIRQDIDGIKEVRGNDGVLLASINVGRRRKKR